ncbi:hypothetical protein ACXWTF_13000 [Thiomicrolovo sp. ZZH C-3]
MLHSEVQQRLLDDILLLKMFRDVRKKALRRGWIYKDFEPVKLGHDPIDRITDAGRAIDWISVAHKLYPYLIEHLEVSLELEYIKCEKGVYRVTGNAAFDLGHLVATDPRFAAAS